MRDHEGCIIAAKSLSKLASLEPVVAKALVALYVVGFSRDLGLQNVIMEGDALQVVNAAKFRGRNWSRYRQIIEDTQRCLI